MKIAILGYGIEGQSVYNYYHAKFPDAEFTAYDNKPEPKNPLPEGVKFVGGCKDFKGITADLAIKTPAIAPWNVGVTGEVTSMTREFLKACPAPVIGVTGSKGKGTTASLIAAILEAAGKKVWLVGNIGVGAFDILAEVTTDDIVVYELSSFQLWDADVSPHVAVVLGIEPEHLDVHRDMNDYVNAKANIAKYQTRKDIVVYRSGNDYASHVADQSPGSRVPYPYAAHVHIRDGAFYDGEQKICSIDALRIPGAHNLENACAAITAVRSWVTEGEIIARGLSAFTGLPHRLQFVRRVNDSDYYDDSIATMPASSMAALRAFNGRKVVILGGSSKNANYSELARELLQHDVTALIIGSEATKIAAACEHAGFTNFELRRNESMEQIVNRAAEVAEGGATVILSPAAASFDMFKSAYDRGEQFTQAVLNL